MNLTIRYINKTADSKQNSVKKSISNFMHSIIMQYKLMISLKTKLEYQLL